MYTICHTYFHAPAVHTFGYVTLTFSATYVEAQSMAQASLCLLSLPLKTTVSGTCVCVCVRSCIRVARPCVHEARNAFTKPEQGNHSHEPARKGMVECYTFTGNEEF